jgi:hypothetical protein
MISRPREVPEVRKVAGDGLDARESVAVDVEHAQRRQRLEILQPRDVVIPQNQFLHPHDNGSGCHPKKGSTKREHEPHSKTGELREVLNLV